MEITSKITPVLMAGGSGTRLWPVSRSKMPKQFCALTGERTMLQETLLRFTNKAAYEAPIVLTHDDYRFIALEQCHAVGITPAFIGLETARRNTGVVGALAALVAAKQNPNALVLLAAADHVITNQKAYEAALQCAALAAQQGYIVTFGITPDKPETGYGYIELGQATETQGVQKVARFVEKPNVETARAYLESGTYVWNSGMFMAQASTLLAEYKALCPALLQAAETILKNAEHDMAFTRFKADDMNMAENISIDFCLMEKTTKAAVLPVNIGWSDVGAWPALHELNPHDAARNSATSNAVLEACHNTMVQARTRPIMAVGLENIAVIDTDDALLVLNMDHTSAMKAAQAKLSTLNTQVLESHPFHTTLWGTVETLEVRDGARIRRVNVHPNQSIAYQSHEHRMEHWFVLKGQASVTLNGQTRTLASGESLTITPNTRHGLKNASATEELVFLEVQTGDYADETDVKRYSVEKPAKASAA